MTSVIIEKSELEELINYKLRNIQKEISKILERWNETSADQFIQKAQNGYYEEAENDAIDIKQLIIEQKRLIERKNNL